MTVAMEPKPLARRLDRRLQFRVWGRSHLLQACWNYERMQNLGFGFALDPWLRRAGIDRRRAIERHLEYFNSQPYMAGFVLGVVGRMEEDAASLPEAQKLAAEARISRLKSAFAAALAGIGDALFWGALRPFCAALAIAVWLTAWTLGSDAPTAWAAAAYLICYNAPAEFLRWKGLALGYAWGEMAAAELKRFRFQDRIRRLRWAGLGLSVALAVAALLFAPWGAGSLAADGAVLGVALAARSFGYPAPRLYTASVGIALLAALAGA